MTKTRVRKARSETCCGYCGSPIRVHQLIALVGAIWVHADLRKYDCLIKIRSEA